MLTNYCNRTQIEMNLGKIDNVIAICLNSKNEKIIKGAFLLTTNIIEILEHNLTDTYVSKFLN
jgi:hypothetical protein